MTDWRERLQVEVMEDYLSEASLKHIAKDDEHVGRMREYWIKLQDFILAITTTSMAYSRFGFVAFIIILVYASYQQNLLAVATLILGVLCGAYLMYKGNNNN